MVTPATSHLDPPKSWEELEEICADLFSREWKDNNTTRHGRQGQRQDGVDIYGRPDGSRYAGVQCKGRSKWPSDPLTVKDIDEEVAKAKRFRPNLSEFIIATVDPNDNAVQNHARRITEEHSKKGLFSVHVSAWPELTRRLTQYDDLIKKHYGYVANAEILRDIKDLPDRVARVIREIPAHDANEQSRAIATAIADPSVAEAMERDLSNRYEVALQRSLFSESSKLDEFQSLADVASAPQYGAVSANLRRRVLLRASRSAAARGFVERGKSLLVLAQTLPGEESDIPARARIAEAEKDVDGAITLLRDQQDADSRSTLLNVLLRSRGPEAALGWLKSEQVAVSSLTPNGIHTFCLCHLQQQLDFQDVGIVLDELTPDQLKDAPYFLLLRAATKMASVLPVPEQHLLLEGLPLQVIRAQLVLPDASAAARLDSALADLGLLLPVISTLGLRESKRLAELYVTWCELLHPYRKSAGLARLREEMKDPRTALTRLQFAFAYDPEFNPNDLGKYLQRREQLGGLDDADLRAMLILRLHSNDPSAVAKLVAQYRAGLEAAFPALAIVSIEIQALAKAGEATSARQLLEQNKKHFSEQMRADLESEVAKAEGADPVEEDLRLYRATGTVDALRSLLGTVARKGDHLAIAQYSEELYQRTNDPHDIDRAARAFRHLDDGNELIRVMDKHPSIAERDADLACSYGWQLFRSGRLGDAKAVATDLEKRTPPARDLHLEIVIAIESGEWESLAVPLGAFLDDVSKHSALDLIRAAHVAQASGRGPMMDLVKAAVAKNEPDANVWAGAYTLIIEEGLENDIRESRQWFERALALSGADGPIQRVELKELMPRQRAWNERSSSISASIVRGELPLILAAAGLRTTIVDTLLRNLVRNSATDDPRRKIAIPLFSGNRRPEPFSQVNCLALDVSALLVMGWLGILENVFNAFSRIVLPATILTELFEGRQRIQRVQKSRIRLAIELEGIIARGHLKLVHTSDAVPDQLSQEVGEELGQFIRAAEAANGIVLRPAPVHRPGLGEVDADVETHTKSVADLHALLSVLIERGAVDQTKEDAAGRYFKLQDKGWSASARPDPSRALFVDQLALAYLQYTGLLDVVLREFKDVRIQAAVHDEALVILEHGRHVTEVLACIDAIRTVVRDANTAGKVVFGARRTEREDASEEYSLSTLHLLANLSDADAIVCDDRALNKEPFAQDSSGKRVRVFTTVDIVEDLKQRSLISAIDRRSLRHRLRVAGAALMPVDAGEIANAALRSKAMKSAEFKAIEESIDLAYLAEVPAFPHEVPWFSALNIAMKAAIYEIWNGETDRQRAAAASDIVIELTPNPDDWITRWGPNGPPEWIAATRCVSVASLAMAIDIDGELVDAYNTWLEDRILGPMRATEPENYQRVVAQVRAFVKSATSAKEDGETPSPRALALYLFKKLSKLLGSDVLADGTVSRDFSLATTNRILLPHNTLIEQPTLFEAFRQSLEGNPVSLLIDQDGKPLTVMVSVDLEGRGLVEIKGSTLSFENVGLLSSNAATRRKHLDKAIARHTLTRHEIERLQAEASRPDFSDQTFLEILEVLATSQESFSSSVDHNVQSRQVALHTLLPDQPNYWDKLLAPVSGSKSLSEFIGNELLLHRQFLLSNDPQKAMRSFAVSFCAPALVPTELLRALSADTVLGMMNEATKFSDHFGLLGAFEICGDWLPRDSRFGSVGEELLDRLFADEKRLNDACWRYSAGFVLATARLHQHQTLRRKPAFWRRVTAAGHASLIARAIGSSNIDPHSFYKWAMDVSGKSYYASICLDSVYEPRWRPDWLGPKMLVPDAFGRADAVLKRLPEGVSNREWAKRIDEAREFLGEGGALFTVYPAIGESGAHRQPTLDEMGELAKLCREFIHDPTADNFLVAGILFYTFGIPAECAPAITKVIVELQQNRTHWEAGKRRAVMMLAIYIAMQLKDRALADAVAEVLIADAAKGEERLGDALFWLIECAAADPDESTRQLVLARRLETLAFISGPSHLLDVADTLKVLQKLDADLASLLGKSIAAARIGARAA